METDLERFIEFYASIGITIEVNIDHKTNTKCVILGEGYHKPFKITSGFEGHPGFYSLVTFDENGKFISQGFWE